MKRTRADFGRRSWVIFTFRSGFWTALGIGWSNGRFRWSLAYPITLAPGLLFGLDSAVTRRAGGDHDTISFGYRYAWGGKGRD